MFTFMGEFGGGCGEGFKGNFPLARGMYDSYGVAFVIRPCRAYALELISSSYQILTFVISLPIHLYQNLSIPYMNTSGLYQDLCTGLSRYDYQLTKLKGDRE